MPDVKTNGDRPTLNAQINAVVDLQQGLRNAGLQLTTHQRETMISHDTVERLQAQRDDAIRAVVSNGAGIRELARTLGLSVSQICEICAKHERGPGGIEIEVWRVVRAGIHAAGHSTADQERVINTVATALRGYDRVAAR